ncbi:MAG: TolC family outer membrane protein [Gammaproteobacteria bacterium]|nr:TolC family outer membrane protein [Gammaproteobacteria bacterium]NIR84144.1 TolC family outer membrane protein [Gammaproteobacteria bacterium]NIR89456.1 TolC family outer membrane protein [Gammaproteobacteria bacterium]NIU05299.1 TolC family outer membrane protein [Gammaproteobacteria bacterium]NIV52239.1 TolC family outer membrane protein [Gammaproteobacteria bacterium]
MERGLIAKAVLCGALLAPAQSRAADLMEVFREAERSDPEYAQVQAATRATLEQKPQARALLLPFLDFTYSTQHNDQDIDSDFGTSGRIDFQSTNWSADLTQPIFRLGRVFGLRQANSNILQADAQLSGALQDLMVRTANRYFNVLAAMDTLEFTRTARRALGRQLEQARKRFEVGVSAITDVQEAQAGFDRAVAAEIRAENDLDNANERLREITGTYFPALAPLVAENMPLTPPDPANIDEWTRVTLEQNLRVQAAQHATETARLEIRRVASEGWLPTADLVGSYNFRDSGGQFGSETETGSIGVEVNVPIFEGGGAVSRTREARALHRESLELLTQEQRTAQRETREAYLGVMSGISGIKALEQAVVSSETALEATRAGFDVGTRTAVDVVEAERRLAEAKRDLARARYDYIVDTLRLKRAAGTLSPNDLQLVNAWLQ